MSWREEKLEERVRGRGLQDFGGASKMSCAIFVVRFRWTPLPSQDVLLA